MEKTLRVNLNTNSYDIIIRDDFSALSEKVGAKKILIFSDNRVFGLYGKEITKLFTDSGKEVHSFVIKEGEKQKTLKCVNSAYEFMLKNGFDRSHAVIALGGGVVGDIAGFIASTYMRGLDFYQVPTTLLAQVDSSVGGKTGVDFMGAKNIIGAFYQPKLVYVNVSTLKTLSKRQFINGLSEVIKHAIIKSSDLFDFLEENNEKILSKDADVLKELVYKNCEIKAKVVERDEREKGERALLNFGHTIGHAIESEQKFKLLHGECVALGMICALFISNDKNLIQSSDADRAMRLIFSFLLPTILKKASKEVILKNIKNDKKNFNDKLKFILIDNIGNAFIDEGVSDGDISYAVDYILK